MEIDSIETGGSGGGGAAAGSYLYGYARCYSFFFWSSRHGRHFFLYFSFMLYIPFFSSFPIYFSVERKHSDSGDQSGRLCAFSFSYFYVCDAKIVNLEKWNAAAEVKIMDVLNVG